MCLWVGGIHFILCALAHHRFGNSSGYLVSLSLRSPKYLQASQNNGAINFYSCVLDTLDWQMLLSGELKADEQCLTENQEARGSPCSCPSQMYDLEITQPVQASRAFYANAR